jgi:hypothetical protein
MKKIKKALYKKALIKLALMCLLFFTIMQTEAQNFNYIFAKDSGAYVSLTSPVFLSSNESWVNKHFKLALPFQFNFSGLPADTIYIETNGYLIFDKNKELATVAFNEFSSRKDTNQSYTASLGYSIEGSSGSRIVKIQFSNVSKNNFSSSDHLNYQVWLYESGNKIEFHIGANAYSLNPEFTNPVMLGLINRNMDSDPKAYLINGTIFSPAAGTVSADEDLIYLNNVPSEGIVFRLTPTF